MGDDSRRERRSGCEQRADRGPPRKPGKLRERARRTDSRPQLVATAKFIRRLLPGDDRYGDALSTTGTQVPQRIGRLVSEVQPERPSAVRELGLGALQAWQALSEAQGRGRGKVDVAILFTDIVGFSSWALDAGDEAALELLRQVAAAEDAAISAHGGSLVKRLGDGAMAVFRAPRGGGSRRASGTGRARSDRGERPHAGASRRRPPRTPTKSRRRLPRRRRQHRGPGRRGRQGGRGAGLRVGPRSAGPGGLQVRPQPATERDAEPPGTSRSVASPLR